MTPALGSDRPLNQLTIPAGLSFLAPSVIEGLIRVGKLNDGGYVLPAASVDEADFLISLGISDDWSFETHFRQLYPRVQIHAYDHTVSQQALWASMIRGLLKMPIGMTSYENFSQRYTLLVSYNNFFAGTVQHFKERVTCEPRLAYDVTMEKVFKRASSSRLFLKIDIEGSEYEIVDDLVKHSDNVVALVIEFHNTGLLLPAFVNAMKALQERYEVVHLHANNFGSIGPDNLPEALEVTFVRKSGRTSQIKKTNLPIPVLDYPNNPKKLDYQIQFTF
jgi:hypothetical protein